MVTDTLSFTVVLSAYSLLILAIFSLLFSGAIGLLTLYHLFIRKKKEPMDESNRINHIRLWWFAITRPEVFAERFPWLKDDEWDIFKDKS